MPSFGITGTAAAGEAGYAGVAASAVHAVNVCHSSVFCVVRQSYDFSLPGVFLYFPGY